MESHWSGQLAHLLLGHPILRDTMTSARRSFIPNSRRARMVLPPHDKITARAASHDRICTAATSSENPAVANPRCSSTSSEMRRGDFAYSIRMATWPTQRKTPPGEAGFSKTHSGQEIGGIGEPPVRLDAFRPKKVQVDGRLNFRKVPSVPLVRRRSEIPLFMTCADEITTFMSISRPAAGGCPYRSCSPWRRPPQK